jgi:hypothetical protein
VTQSAAALSLVDYLKKIDASPASAEEAEADARASSAWKQQSFDVAHVRPAASALPCAKKVDKAVVVTFIPPFRS